MLTTAKDNTYRSLRNQKTPPVRKSLGNEGNSDTGVVPAGACGIALSTVPAKISITDEDIYAGIPDRPERPNIIEDSSGLGKADSKLSRRELVSQTDNVYAGIPDPLERPNTIKERSSRSAKGPIRSVELMSQIENIYARIPDQPEQPNRGTGNSSGSTNDQVLPYMAMTPMAPVNSDQVITPCSVVNPLRTHPGNTHSLPTHKRTHGTKRVQPKTSSFTDTDGDTDDAGYMVPNYTNGCITRYGDDVILLQPLIDQSEGRDSPAVNDVSSQATSNSDAEKALVDQAGTTKLQHTYFGSEYEDMDFY